MPNIVNFKYQYIEQIDVMNALMVVIKRAILTNNAKAFEANLDLLTKEVDSLSVSFRDDMRQNM